MLFGGASGATSGEGASRLYVLWLEGDVGIAVEVVDGVLCDEQLFHRRLDRSEGYVLAGGDPVVSKIY
jgi:hypothetical protein